VSRPLPRTEVTYASAPRRLWAFALDLFGLWLGARLAVQAGGGVFAWSLWGVFAVGYEIGWVTLGGTPGKRLAGLRVVRAKDGGPVRLGSAVVRELMRALSLLPLGFGFWWMLDSDRRQGWHDVAAETVVVRERRTNPGPEWGAAPPWRTAREPHDAAPPASGAAAGPPSPAA
jgi:uncharacterized RDD family membrane protein YckC